MSTGFASADPGVARYAAGSTATAAARTGELSFLSVTEDERTGNGALAACQAGRPGGPEVIRQAGGGA